MAGDGRWSPAAAGVGRGRPESGSPSPSILWGASVAQNGRVEFCKRDFGERSNSSSERARRGEEDGMVVGGQGGVCGGGTVSYTHLTLPTKKNSAPIQMRWPELAGDGRNPIAQTQASCGVQV